MLIEGWTAECRSPAVPLLQGIRHAVAALILLAALSPARADAEEPPFGTCASWRDTKREAERLTPEGSWKRFYRIGLSHGFVLGIGADFWSRLPAEASSPDEIFALAHRYADGYYQALIRPAIMMDVFDTKCDDYRNRALRLADVGFLALLEIGGVHADRIEEAMRRLRLASGPTASQVPADVFGALLGLSDDSP